jgi:hypothetical protein
MKCEHCDKEATINIMDGVALCCDDHIDDALGEIGARHLSQVDYVELD